jgi:hypothetical protein
MATRETFLRQLWTDVINSNLREQWIDHLIANSKLQPDAPFADTGPALERLLNLGVKRRELCLLARHVAYEAVFSTLYMLEDPGIEAGNEAMLHESLLAADPSGNEGRPGSA